MINFYADMQFSVVGLMKVGYQIAYINFNLKARSLVHAIRASGANILIVGEGNNINSPKIK